MIFALIHLITKRHRAVDPKWYCMDFGECIRICSRCGEEC